MLPLASHFDSKFLKASMENLVDTFKPVKLDLVARLTIRVEHAGLRAVFNAVPFWHLV